MRCMFTGYDIVSIRYLPHCQRMHIVYSELSFIYFVLLILCFLFEYYKLMLLLIECFLFEYYNIDSGKRIRVQLNK